MTLRERFKQWLNTDPREQIREVPLEIIADDFAIGFVEWKDKNCFVVNGSDFLYYIRDSDEYDDAYTNTELLKIYKKEKGL